VAIFIKLFWQNLQDYQHISLSCDSGYTATSLNYTGKSFMKSTPVANLIKLFWHNLGCYWYIALSFDSDYATRGVNYSCKKYYEMNTWSFHKIGDSKILDR
jgi:hypothetical protein